jgi:eukaryotic-like serine/threonine-protein kinase
MNFPGGNAGNNAPLVGQLVDNRYQVTGFLARGGMATVYIATDTRLDRVVALKVMHPHLASDPGFVARFQREARSAARLSHPHVVGVFDQGDSDGQIYLAMEYIPGRTLRDVLDEYGPLTLEQALVLLDPVLEALNAAHAAGFVHRDIKPENVLISDDGRVKVADFGLARAVASSESTQTAGMIIGTVTYLSPEQVERGDADARSDIYSTGILLFEMITGTVPHSGESPLSIAYQHVNADVPAPTTVNPDLPREADALVVSATKRDPQLRYQNAHDFLADLRRIRNSLPAPRPFVDIRDTLVVSRDSLDPNPSLKTGNKETGNKETGNNENRPAKDFIPRQFPDRQPRKRGWIVALGIAIGVAVAGFAGWWLAAGPGTYIPAPNVVGQTIEQAEQNLANTEFTLAATERSYSETIPEGVIISTDPAPGDGISPSGTINATISQGPERYLVPDVKGASPEAASAAILAANLAVGGRVEAFDDTIPSGMVAKTEPKIGSELKPGTTVDLIISKGPKPVEIPRVVGEKIKMVESQLTDLGLSIQRSNVFSETVPKNTVISIKPKAGTTVNSGTSVDLVVSKGPPPVTVPNLVDMPRKKAIAQLQRLGLKANVQVGEVAPLNRVISQSPAAGTEIPKGSTVTIRII